MIIKDSGIGIPESVLKSLFELSAKKAQKDTQGRKSSGLGLHLVKSMISLNNGKIQNIIKRFYKPGFKANGEWYQSAGKKIKKL